MIPLLQALGHQIYIISGPHEEVIYDRLEKLGIEKDGLYIESVADYLIDKGDIHWYTNDGNNFWTTDEIWWASKARLCTDREIDVLIDDQYEYCQPELMPNTQFILYQKARFVCAPKT